MMSDVSRRTRPAGARPDDVPVATRAASAGWRDPRLWVGVVLVVGSVVVGARVLATADDHTSVWVAARDLAPGTVIGMIDAFGSLAASQQAADPQLLASGIWTALTTTAAGLAIALVAYFVAAWLDGLEEAELPLPGHVVADLALGTRSATRAEGEALTVVTA